ncbi:MAG: hypothetical protein CL610_20825 [Anaerolineaceae bacterium]|nr:hypothetical protein [Anaerolineaceae bacterium]
MPVLLRLLAYLYQSYIAQNFVLFGNPALADLQKLYRSLTIWGRTRTKSRICRFVGLATASNVVTMLIIYHTGYITVKEYKIQFVLENTLWFLVYMDSVQIHRLPLNHSPKIYAIHIVFVASILSRANPYATMRAAR